MGWTYRAVERPGGRWECRHGLTVFDDHAHCQEAVDHLRVVAATDAPSTVWVHGLTTEPDVVACYV